MRVHELCAGPVLSLPENGLSASDCSIGWFGVVQLLVPDTDPRSWSAGDPFTIFCRVGILPRPRFLDATFGPSLALRRVTGPRVLLIDVIRAPELTVRPPPVLPESSTLLVSLETLYLSSLSLVGSLI